MKYFLSISVITLLFNSIIFSQAIDKTHETYTNTVASFEVLKELLAIPNDAHYPEQIEKNIQWTERVFSQINFTTSRLETKSVPLLLAKSRTWKKELPVMLFYFHLDGQPVDPDFWYQDNPYDAVLKTQVEGEGWVDIEWSNLEKKDLNPEWRIFARSSSDDKSPFVMFLAALKTVYDKGLDIPYNLKIVLDFEEEIGSPNLAQAVVNNEEELAADMLIIFDGPKHSSNRPTIAYGARGITTLTLKVFGPTFPLHSGHYGNYAPNPALRLARLLSSMKDEEGKVLIPGFYDGIQLDAKTKAILGDIPDDENQLRMKLGIGGIDKVGDNYQESLQYPSLNIRGMASGWVGKEARTIVPASAIAEIDIRLVVESDGDRLKQLVVNHIEEQGYFVTEHRPNSQERYLHDKICQVESNWKVTKAFRTEFDSKLGVWIYETIKSTFQIEPIRMRTMGGTLPTSPFIVTLDVPAVIVPLVNSDNNQHSPNENLRLGNYFDGVKCIYGILLSKYN